MTQVLAAGSPIPLRYHKEVIRYTLDKTALVALGDNLTANVLLGNLPAKSRILRALLQTKTAVAGVTAMTVAIGTNSASYNNMLVAADVKAAANTLYGDALTEIGAALQNLSGSYIDFIPSLTVDTAIYALLTVTTEKLKDITAGEFDMLVEYETLP